jgi:preprotein translocase subunit YajC
MTLNLLVLFAPLLIIGIIFVIVFTIQDRKQAKQK